MDFPSILRSPLEAAAAAGDTEYDYENKDYATSDKSGENGLVVGGFVGPIIDHLVTEMSRQIVDVSPFHPVASAFESEKVHTLQISLYKFVLLFSHFQCMEQRLKNTTFNIFIKSAESSYR